MSLAAALRRAVAALSRNPVLFVPVAVLALLLASVVAFQSVDPGMANFATVVVAPVAVLAAPFVHGGLFAAADEALAGRTSTKTITAAGRSHYLPLSVVFLGVGVVVVLVGAFLAVALAVVVIARYPGGAGDTTVLVAGVGLVVAVGLTCAVVAGLFAQFVPHAIVLEGRGLVGGVRRSVTLVRANLTKTVRYTLVAGGLGGVIGLATAGASLAGRSGWLPALGLAPPGVPGAGALLVAVAVGGLTTILGGVLATLSVAVFRDLSASRPGD